MANGRAESRCDNCGTTDDHPKLHYGNETYHHDCIPARVMDDIESETTYEVVDTGAGREQRVLGRRKLDEDELPDAVKHLRRVVDHARKQKPAAQDGDKGRKLLAFIEKGD